MARKRHFCFSYCLPVIKWIVQWQGGRALVVPWFAMFPQIVSLASFLESSEAWHLQPENYLLEILVCEDPLITKFNVEWSLGISRLFIFIIQLTFQETNHATTPKLHFKPHSFARNSRYVGIFLSFSGTRSYFHSSRPNAHRGTWISHGRSVLYHERIYYAARLWR